MERQRDSRHEEREESDWNLSTANKHNLNTVDSICYKGCYVELIVLLHA